MTSIRLFSACIMIIPAPSTPYTCARNEGRAQVEIPAIPEVTLYVRVMSFYPKMVKKSRFPLVYCMMLRSVAFM